MLTRRQLQLALSSSLMSAPTLLLPRAYAQGTGVGTVQRAEGFVRLVGSSGDRTVSGATVVQEGDRLITTPQSEAVVKLNDGAIVAVRPNSELVFVQQRFTREAPRDGSSVMELIRGGLRQVTGLISKVNPSAVRVTTATATIGVRGTDFESVQIDTQSVAMGTSLAPGNYTRVFTGATLVESRSGERVTVNAGQASFAPNVAFGAAMPFGLMRSIPSGVFTGGRLDGTMGTMQRDMMRQIGNEMRGNLPPELQQIFPDLGNLQPRR